MKLIAVGLLLSFPALAADSVCDCEKQRYEASVLFEPLLNKCEAKLKACNSKLFKKVDSDCNFDEMESRIDRGVDLLEKCDAKLKACSEARSVVMSEPISLDQPFTLPQSGKGMTCTVHKDTIKTLTISCN